MKKMKNSVFSYFIQYILIIECTISIISKKMTGFYVDNGLGQTVIHDLSYESGLNLEEEMRNLLDLPEKPRYTEEKSSVIKRSAPMFLIDVYEMLDNDKDEKFDEKEFIENDIFDITDRSKKTIDQSDIIMTFAAQNHKISSNTMKTNKVKRLWFDVSKVSPHDEIIHAELKLYRSVKLSGILGKQEPAMIKVYRVASARDDNGSRKFIFVDSVNTTEKDGWVTLNITESLHHWIYSSEPNRGLYLAAFSADRPNFEIRPEAVGIIGFGGDPEKAPFMVGYFKSTRERKKRRIDYSSYYKHDWYEELLFQRKPTPCKRESLYVSFKDLQWDNWIIKPNGYDAFYCYGECNFPLGTEMNATAHALIQTLVNLRDPSKAPKPCCAPHKLSAINVVYKIDEEIFTLKKYREMVVENCGCQ